MEGIAVEITRNEHSTNKFTVEGSSTIPEYDTDMQYCFYIKDSFGVQHGLMYGVLTKKGDSVKFEVSNSRNQKRGTPEYAHRIVSDAISELLIRGIVNQWYSSQARTGVAEHMYRDILSANEKLRVFPPNEINGNRYLVIAKNQK